MKKFNKIFPILIIVFLICSICVFSSCKNEKIKGSDGDLNNKENKFEESNEVINVTEGLEYTFISKSNSYEVKGIGSVIDKKIRIPEKYDDGKNGMYPVTSIGAAAFKNSTNLSHVIMPDSVIIIKHSAFYGCSGLKSVSMSSSVASILDSAFLECINLTNITIPEGVTYIGMSAFERCYKLVEVYNKSSLTIDKGNYGLSYAKNIYNEEKETKLRREGDFIIYLDRKFKKLISYEGDSSDVSIPEGVTNIEDRAFLNCYDLKNVLLPSSLISIGEESFLGCRDLRNITIQNNVTNIGDRAFSGCSNLANLTIPENVMHIGVSAFNNCYRLLEVYNKSSLTINIIGTYGLDYVKNIYREEGGSKLSKEGDYVIYTDGDLKEVVRYDGTATEITIPDNVTSIGDYAFKDCSNLINIIIPPSVISIGHYAFYNCNNIISITYQDTQEEWNKVNKGLKWDSGISNYEMYYVKI